MTELSVALAQAEPVRYDKAANLACAARLVGEAAARGASLVLFSELFLTGYLVWDRLGELAEPPDGPSIQKLRTVAREHRVVIICGFPEAAAGGAPYNSACVIDRNGDLLGIYRKTHLFDGEPEFFRAGDRLATFASSVGRIGPLICYDLEFPEPARVLALQGAELIAVATANMEPYQEDQASYVRARARENGVYVALTNAIGRDERFRYFGESVAVDPLGSRLAHAGSGEELVLATLDLAAVGRVQQSSPYLARRRPDLYQPLTARAREAR